ncbi:hypothetical protein SNEBB_001697 [Seison nebaliae]|nr:hypothetical protein SNEBB_001697 [Seison nebaliae]
MDQVKHIEIPKNYEDFLVYKNISEWPIDTYSEIGKESIEKYFYKSRITKNLNETIKIDLKKLVSDQIQVESLSQKLSDLTEVPNQLKSTDSLLIEKLRRHSNSNIKLFSVEDQKRKIDEEFHGNFKEIFINQNCLLDVLWKCNLHLLQDYASLNVFRHLWYHFIFSKQFVQYIQMKIISINSQKFNDEKKKIFSNELKKSERELKEFSQYLLLMKEMVENVIDDYLEILLEMILNNLSSEKNNLKSINRHPIINLQLRRMFSIESSSDVSSQVHIDNFSVTTSKSKNLLEKKPEILKRLEALENAIKCEK